uniref:Uncharacterized protein n=1 Tax=uncultured Vibrionales bacterium HF0010_22E23 TaxID=710999 RepID=E0XRJ0_9GAMM|nr:hypothetical protein [uncultured Vibrionales bacterium HF0010_22E23]
MIDKKIYQCLLSDQTKTLRSYRHSQFVLLLLFKSGDKTQQYFIEPLSSGNKKF